jgi:hypothetical protein
MLQRLFPSGKCTAGRTPRDKISCLQLRDGVVLVGLHRLQVRPVHYTAQIDIVAEVGGSDWLVFVGVNLLLVRSINDAIGVHIGR